MSDFEYSPDFWHAVVRAAEQTVNTHSVRLLKVQVKDVQDGKANVQRPYNDAPDGVYWPVVSPAYKPKAGEWVWALVTPGGLLVLGRTLAAGDTDLTDYLPLIGGTLTGDLTIDESNPQVRLRKSGGPIYNAWLRNDGNYLWLLLDTTGDGSWDQFPLRMDPSGGLRPGGDLDMNNNRIRNLPAPDGGNQPATKSYVDSADATKLDLSGGTMSGNLDMNTNRIFNLPDPAGAAQPATKNYTDNTIKYGRYFLNTGVVHVASGYVWTLTLPDTYLAPDTFVGMFRKASQANFRFSAGDADPNIRFYYDRQKVFKVENNTSAGIYFQLIVRWY